ncbi:MAG: DEAD/DEAH box helicase family protein, partial [Anaerolineae bacterium]|nr:DEAD/DEAH box helicase family protein [Anaerolineae bacterium]
MEAQAVAPPPPPDTPSETPPARRGRGYWQAQGLAELTLSEFHAALAQQNRAAIRRAFFRLVGYYTRTLYILRSALEEGKEPLAQASLRNLVVLHRPLAQMHSAAPDIVPLTLTVNREARDRVVKDLMMRVLAETPEPLPLAVLAERVNALHLLGQIGETALRRHLDDLVASEYVVNREGRFARTGRAYPELNLDEVSLRALVGESGFAKLDQAGFQGLAEIEARQATFRPQFAALFGVGEETTSLFLEVITTLLAARGTVRGPWRHADLIGSPYPRPYQYEAYAVFRSHGYQGQLIEAPTGSGKTMIGMLCIQDWLRVMTPGQSILVLVPTTNYQQQWIGELCYSPIGLQLSPEVVFAGTPVQLEKYQQRSGAQPAVMLMTYTALAQTGSGIGKGGFDIDSIEMFLQGANVQYIILDEVHKVVEDTGSVSTDVMRQLVAWMRDGSVRGLVGFSGTAAAYRPRFVELGFDLAHTIPLSELVAYGFVAPFAEYGFPFAYSTRERRIRDLLDRYKAHLREYLALLGPMRLRAWFAELPLAERVTIGHRLLGMYRGRSDAQAVLAQRLTGWEKGGALTVNDAALVTILQIGRGWSDADLAASAGVDGAEFQRLRQSLDAIRRELGELIYLPRSVARLRANGFGETLDQAALRDVREVRAAAARVERAHDSLASTFVGLYDGLSDWYQRVGEGRVEAVQAIIEAERSRRPVGGMIVFDTGKRIRWREATPAPGYEGVGGLFAQLLGDTRFTVLAALSGELYLTYDEADPLPTRIAGFIEAELLRREVGGAIFRLVTQGLDLAESVVDELRAQFTALVESYVQRLPGLNAARPGDFSRRVLGPLRRAVRKARLGAVGERLYGRLDLRNIHLTDLILTFFDYAALAEDFRRARVAELEQVSGARQKFFVVPMPAGRRKQLMYDLTGRIVDAEALPVNMVIVSSWARTGWNVIRPNLLIDATATRDVTAWQQLRGRAMRALRT